MTTDKVSELVANTPEANGVTGSEDIRKELENRVKLELLAELSLDDIRSMVQLVKNGTRLLPPGQQDYPDEFDEFGRNFRRMVHRMECVGPSGHTYFDERPMALSLKEAREMKPPGDFFDNEDKVWVLRGVKRQRDYAENTVGYMQSGKWENK